MISKNEFPFLAYVEKETITGIRNVKIDHPVEEVEIQRHLGYHQLMKEFGAIAHACLPWPRDPSQASSVADFMPVRKAFTEQMEAQGHNKDKRSEIFDSIWMLISRAGNENATYQELDVKTDTQDLAFEVVVERATDKLACIVNKVGEKPSRLDGEVQFTLTRGAEKLVFGLPSNHMQEGSEKRITLSYQQNSEMLADLIYPPKT